MTIRRPKLLLIGIALLATCSFYGCKKDKDSPNGGTLDRPLFLHVDSACIQLPNVFTPNADGINDILVVEGNNVTDLHMTVKTFSGDLLWQGDGTWPGWDGRMNGILLPNRAYRVTIQATSLSGHALQGTTNVFLAGDPAHTCFSDEQEPITGDMFDARQCAPVYNTNDLFCREQ